MSEPTLPTPANPPTVATPLDPSEVEAPVTPSPDLSPEPDEASLPPKPDVPQVEEDTSVPGEDPVADEDFMDSDSAGLDETVDDGEADHQNDQVEGQGGEGEKYEGGPIPH